LEGRRSSSLVKKNNPEDTYEEEGGGGERGEIAREQLARKALVEGGSASPPSLAGIEGEPWLGQWAREGFSRGGKKSPKGRTPYLTSERGHTEKLIRSGGRKEERAQE